MQPVGFDVNLADLAAPRHTAAIVSLLDEFARETSPGGAMTDDVRRRLPSELPALPTARVWLAWEGDQPIGVLVAFLGYSTFQARPLLNIHDIVVRPASRRRGVGRALLAAVEGEASKLGCCKLTLEVYPENFAAQRLYRQLGFDSNPTHPQCLFWTKPLA